MEEAFAELGSLPDGVLWGLVLYSIVAIGIQIWALVDLWKAEKVVGGRKWLWVLAILFFSNMALGAIVYLVVGRRVQEQAPEPDAPAAPQTDRAARAVDSLYGSDSDVSR